MKSYAEGHPLNRKEEAEKMSGIERMRGEWREKQAKEGKGREGKLNVFVDGDESAGRVG